MRTAQQLFDTSVQGLRAQGACSISENGEHCAYRGERGRKCAIGFLIDDSLYNSKMEGKSIGALFDQHLLSSELEQEFRSHKSLLTELQRVHDHSFLDDWEECFSGIATYFGLQYIPPSQS